MNQDNSAAFAAAIAAAVNTSNSSSHGLITCQPGMEAIAAAATMVQDTHLPNTINPLISHSVASNSKPVSADASASASVEALMVQGIPGALFTPDLSTPLMDAFTSPTMMMTPSPAMSGNVKDYMDTPLIGDFDDLFLLPTSEEDQEMSLFPGTSRPPTSTPSSDNAVSPTSLSNAASTTYPLGSTTGTSSLVGGTTVRTLPNGGVEVTTRRGTTTISASQAEELISGVKRRRTGPSASGLPRPTPVADTNNTAIYNTPMAPTALSPTTSVSSATTIDRMDPTAMKRVKNTDAARRSRLRKVLKMEALERRLDEVEKENNTLRTRLAVLENEKESWRISEREMREQVRSLERRLDDAHRALRNEVTQRASNGN